MKKIIELLQQHPFTAGLEGEVIALIAGCAKNVVFRAQETVFREGQSADNFYLIRHGTVALEMFVPGRGAVTFLTIKSGEVVGLNWLIPPYRWSYDATAIELTWAIAFDAQCLRHKCDSDHHVGYEIMKRFVPPLIERLQTARLQSADVYGDGEH